MSFTNNVGVAVGTMDGDTVGHDVVVGLTEGKTVGDRV